VATKIKAYKISKANLDKNRLPNYSELNDGITQISPIKMRKIESFKYHVAEDVKGDIYLIENDTVILSRLYDRNIGVTETAYMLDGLGRQQIKKAKESSVQEDENEVESSETLTVTKVDIENKEITFTSDKHQEVEETEGDKNG
jgi:hypothetical protein